MSAATTAVTEPGVYSGMPESVYLGDPVPGGSLSSSGARRLLPPYCPARFRYERDNPPVSTAEFDFGKVAHRLVLGAGPEVVVVDHDDWRTKAAKESRKQAHDDGAVPLLRADHDRAVAMAAVLLSHPLAGALFAEHGGDPEQSLFWTDPETGVRRRARLDWLPHPRPGRRLVVPDYKTCVSADPEALRRAVHSYGYHQQADWYLNAVRALDLDDDPVFVFVAQEKQPPYLVHVFQLDPEALRAGAALNRRALRVYAECARTGVWPGYADDDVTEISLPPWAATEEPF